MIKGKLEGIEDFKKLLEKLDRKTQKKVIRQAIRAGAKVFAKEMKANAPVETGRLKRSIKVRMGKRRKNIISVSAYVTGGRESEEASVALFKEFGTKHMEKKPFVGPAFDTKEDEVMQLCLKSIGDGIDSILKEFGPLKK
jgi:HK97 gp10 family phage protein